MSWLRRLTRRRASPEVLLNEGLGLAMDWGQDWLAPIQARLRERHPYLDAAKLEQLNASCQGAMRLAHETVHGRLRDGVQDISVESLAAVVRARYPWVDQDNLVRLLKQSLYYAAKVGGHA